MSRRTVWWFVAAGAAAAAVTWLALSPGVHPLLVAFWRGSLGTPSAFFSGTLVRAIPLALLGVGLSIAFRAGAFNIGGEGQLLLGAVAATVTGLYLAPAGPAAILAALGAAALAGAAWAGIAGALRWRFGVLEVISTLMLNFVAASLVSFLVRGPLQEPTRIYPQTESLDAAVRLPAFTATTRLHLGLLLALAVAVAGWWFMSRTAAGFRIRAAGESPDAARTVGRVDVGRVTMMAMLLSGGAAGLAGGVEVLGVTFALYENVSPGYGFSAIAVAVLARLNPIAVLPSALLFATLATGALGMQRDAGVPSTVAAVLEAIAILLVVAFRGTFPLLSWRRAAGPAAAGTAA